MSRSALLEDWSLKLFSLGSAVLLFLFVTVEHGTSTDVDFRIEYRLSDDMMLTNDAPTSLHATLQGPWASLRSFDMGDLEPVVIDMSAAEPGVQRHTINTSAINPPGGMQVMSVQPAEIEIALDRRSERQVPVHPDIPESPAFGYEILDVRIVPPRARVLGPGSKMQSIDFITTRTIDVTGREDDLKLEVDLRPPPPPLRLVDKRVLVFVEIGEEFTQRTVGGVPVHAEGAPRGSRLDPTEVSIVLKGPRRVLDRLDKQSLEAFVDVAAEAAAGAVSADKPVQLRPELPERTQVVSPIPKVAVQMPATKRGNRRVP